MSAACTAWFYSPARDRVTGLNVVNKIVAGLDPPFCHVELQFPSGEACSIVMSGRVSMRARRFDPEFYTGVRVEAPAPAVGRALALARRHVELGTGFGVGGARTFCSKLVADLLRESGMVREEELGGALLISPSALHRRLGALALSRAVKSGPAPAGAGARAGPLAPIAFAESAVQPSCPPRHRVSPVAFSGPCMHLTLRSGSGADAPEPRQKEKVPEERRLLLGA
jgi:hypothetical protein